MNKKDEQFPENGGEIDIPKKVSYIVLNCLTVLCLDLSGPHIIRKAQSRHKTA